MLLGVEMTVHVSGGIGENAVNLTKINLDTGIHLVSNRNIGIVAE